MGNRQRIQKKMMILTLAGTVLAGTAACRNPGSSTDAGKSGKRQTGEPVTITAMVQDFQRDRTQEIDKLLEEKTNIKIDWMMVPEAEYEAQLKTKMDAGELPDLFQIDMTEVQNSKDKSSFVNFKDYLEQMPNLRKWMQEIPEIYSESADEEGDIYALASFNTRDWVAVMPIYRQDIWEKEGLAVPQDMNQLYEELVYLKQKYPDASVVANRRGVYNLVTGVSTLYRCDSEIYLDNEKQRYCFGPAEERFKAVIALLRKFYAAGLIDPEFSTMSDEQFYERVTDGKVFFMFSEYIAALHTEGNRNWVGKGKEKNPDFELAPMPALRTEFGDTGVAFHSAVNYPQYSVAVNAESEHVSEIMAFLDAQLSDEILCLANWGG